MKNYSILNAFVHEARGVLWDGTSLPLTLRVPYLTSIQLMQSPLAPCRSSLYKTVNNQLYILNVLYITVSLLL